MAAMMPVSVVMSAMLSVVLVLCGLFPFGFTSDGANESGGQQPVKRPRRGASNQDMIRHGTPFECASHVRYATSMVTTSSTKPVRVMNCSSGWAANRWVKLSTV